jgi:uncharacterized DUF497 family protein
MYSGDYRFIATMNFEWDEAKNRENVIKHDVSFNRAIEVFDDPVALTQPDRFHDGEEERWNTLGAIGPGTILFVVHTQRGEETIRIISARAATSGERKAYEEAHRRATARNRRDRRQVRR